MEIVCGIVVLVLLLAFFVVQIKGLIYLFKTRRIGWFIFGFIFGWPAFLWGCVAISEKRNAMPAI